MDAEGTPPNDYTISASPWREIRPRGTPRRFRGDLGDPPGNLGEPPKRIKSDSGRRLGGPGGKAGDGGRGGEAGGEAGGRRKKEEAH